MVFSETLIKNLESIADNHLFNIFSASLVEQFWPARFNDFKWSKACDEETRRNLTPIAAIKDGNSLMRWQAQERA